jgi:hypothetical protein
MYRCSSTKVYPSEGNARCTVVTVRFIVDRYLAPVRTARSTLPCRRYVSDDCILPSGLDLELDNLSLVLNARTGVLAPVPDSCYPREAIRERSASCQISSELLAILLAENSFVPADNMVVFSAAVNRRRRLA